ncbi:hypothetical protein GLX30_11165 [Streptomyces sp. Tu 2975]|nr:hypothetical protein GLX30_11165 [Streptomyces sp. Tu 2975]
MFNAFEEIFAPGRKHTDDERNRLALTRVDVGDGDPGRGPIDLDSGKVTVHPRAPHAADVDDAAGRGGPPAEWESAGADDGGRTGTRATPRPGTAPAAAPVGDATGPEFETPGDGLSSTDRRRGPQPGPGSASERAAGGSDPDTPG